MKGEDDFRSIKEVTSSDFRTLVEVQEVGRS